MMKTLIVEDDMVSRQFLYKFLSRYGECDLTVDGIEALDAFLIAMKEGNPYELVCLDVMMPKVDGIRVLKALREIEKQQNVEEEKRVKVIMTTALAGTQMVQEAFLYGCEGYAAKPIDTDKFTEVLKKLGLIS